MNPTNFLSSRIPKVSLILFAYIIGGYCARPDVVVQHQYQGIIGDSSEDRRVVCADIIDNGLVDICMIDSKNGDVGIEGSRVKLYLSPNLIEQREISPGQEIRVIFNLPPGYTPRRVVHKGSFETLKSPDQRRYTHKLLLANSSPQR